MEDRLVARIEKTETALEERVSQIERRHA